jgi:hypothetical protein
MDSPFFGELFNLLTHKKLPLADLVGVQALLLDQSR